MADKASRGKSSEKEDVRFCKFCGALFRYNGFSYGYCPTCTKIDNEIFQRVKDYVWTHPKATEAEVSEVVGVSIKQIKQYLRDGRLEIPEDSPIFLKCEQCSANIRYGRFCRDCAVQISKKFGGERKVELYEIGEKPKSQSGKMHYLNNKK